ncbi:MAG: ATP-binding protein, partial [Myxococcales bacterium]
ELLREHHAAHRGGSGAAPAVRSGLQLQARRKDGRLCAVEVNLSPLQTPDGTQVIAAVRDVTRRRELERFRDEYVGYISHDLKNPLSVIALQARLLARKLDGRPMKEEQHAVAVIAESAAFIDRLVRELLEMAYVESDEIELHPEPLELSGFLQSVLERTVSTPDRSRVLLEIAAPCTVSAESGRLERVVVNFVQNAIKYSPPGSRIQVRLEAQEDLAEVSVIDRGPGIAKEEQQSIFEKYKRAPEARNKEGLGLGLYVSRKIAEAHGGVVGVESVPGQGARFYIRLPRIAAQAAAAIGPVEQAERSDLHGLRVLLVDDEVNAVSALTTLLSEEGLIVAPATSGEQALAALASARPDVAVLDVQMPGMSGLELLSALRVRRPGLPAVIMSGHMERHAGIAEARLSTGAAYVGKPVNVDDLLRTLGRLFLARPPS